MSDNQTALQTALDQYENRIGGKFKPDQRFYARVSINPKRYGQLIRGDKRLYAFEAQNLSEYFNVPLSQLITNEKPGN